MGVNVRKHFSIKSFECSSRKEPVDLPSQEDVSLQPS